MELLFLTAVNYVTLTVFLVEGSWKGILGLLFPDAKNRLEWVAIFQICQLSSEAVENFVHF